jgi:hypothetical protein
LKKRIDPYQDFLKSPATKSSHIGFLYADDDRSVKSMEGFMAKEPKTKEQFLNRMLMTDFSGDIRDLATDRNIQLKRTSANKLELTFLSSGQKFELIVRKPRSPEQIAKMNEKRTAKAGGGKKPGRKTPAQHAQH